MRHKRAPKRIIAPDPRYHRTDVSKFVNYIMRRGKKTTAERVVYTAFDLIAAESKQDPIEIFDAALRNITPQVEVRSRRVGGANYQIPTPVRGERRQALAFRWIIAAAEAKKGKPMAARLAEEFLAAAAGEGSAVKKRMDVQRMADANRAFAHFAR